jgi:hypothetical protein
MDEIWRIILGRVVASSGDERGHAQFAVLASDEYHLGGWIGHPEFARGFNAVYYWDSNTTPGRLGVVELIDPP